MTRFREVVERIRDEFDAVRMVLRHPVLTARILDDHRDCAYRLNEARKLADLNAYHDHHGWRRRCQDLEGQLNELKRLGREREQFISAISSLTGEES